jgi:hypothetical protein
MELKKSLDFTQKEIAEVEKISAKLEEFRINIINIDYIHNREDFFKLMKDFRKYIASLDDNLYRVFFHSQDYKFFKNFFTDIHEYYLRSLEAIQSLKVMTK